MKKHFLATMAAAAIIAAPMALPAAHASEVYANKSCEKHDTLIGIGSVSKTFVSAAVMQLADKGLIDIDAPLTDYIPEFRMADSRYSKITPRMLMDHTSGLMGTTEGDFMLYNDRDTAPHDTMLEEISKQRLKADPGDFGAYCNDGFELLEILVERVSGTDYTDYLEKNICKPLGLEQTGTPWNDFRTNEQVKAFSSDKVNLVPDYCMDIGSGGILSTAPELAQFGSIFFRSNNDMLSEKSKQEMITTKVTDKYEDGFGLGLDQVDYKDYADAGVKVVSKGGDTQHQHAALLVAPDEEISVSVLSSGGNSTIDTMLAMSLMDIALEDKGINITHSEPSEEKLLSEVPEKYLAYEGNYISSSGTYHVSFPERKYMEISCLTSEKPSSDIFMYTADDKFLQMEGNIEEGKVYPTRDKNLVSFVERNGKDFICSDCTYDLGGLGRFNMPSYNMQRADDNNISEKLQKAWNERSGRKYYLYNGKYSNCIYMIPVFSGRTSPQAMGYFGGYTIKDSNHCTTSLSMPGGRDITDIEAVTRDGCEFIKLTDQNLEYISEESIPLLGNDVTQIELKTKKAAWYKIGNAENKTISLDIPENAAVYVFDKYDKVIYSSHMTEYGNTVPLPNEGKILFLGEDGGIIEIAQ